MSALPTLITASRPEKAQRGVALLTALLVMVVAAGIAVALVAQQSQALSRTQRASDFAQAAALAEPVLDYARDSMRQSFTPGKPVGLNQAWAQGIAALPVEGGSATGRLVDQGGLFNLNNLAKDGKRSADDVETFRRLLVALSLKPDLADAAADWIDADDETSLPGGQENALYFAQARPVRAANRAIAHASELARARGFDEAAMQRLAPFITALPVRTKLNVNTAPEELLTAALPELKAEERIVLARLRQRAPFENITGANGLAERFKSLTPATLERLDVKSDFFLAQIGLELGTTRIAKSALLRRTGGTAAEGWPAIIWSRSSL